MHVVDSVDSFFIAASPEAPPEPPGQTPGQIPGQPPGLRRDFSETVLALGGFDGVHLGHQSLLAEARAWAGNRPCVMLGFDPPPRLFFATRQTETSAGHAADGTPGMSGMRGTPGVLSDPFQRARWGCQLGLQGGLFLEFDAKLACMTAEAFIETVLHRMLRARFLICGEDFRFGVNREGSISSLHAFQGAFRVAKLAHQAPHPGDTKEQTGRAKYSSSRIRELIQAGDLDEAQAHLSRPYCVRGRLQRGRGHATQLGMPTLNIDPGSYVRPPQGSYAGFVKIEPARAGPGSAAAGLGAAALGLPGPPERAAGPPERDTGPLGPLWPATLYWARRPDGPDQLEAHLHDFEAISRSGGLQCGQMLEVSLMKFLRPREDFASKAALKAAMVADKAAAQKFFASVAAAYGRRA